MLLAIALAGAALRAGLRLRGARRARRPRRREELRRHARFGKLAVALIAAGGAGGPLSAVWLRGWEAFGTLHAWVGLGVVLVAVNAALLGRRLERGDLEPVEIHGLLGLLLALTAAGAFVTGFVLLP